MKLNILPTWRWWGMLHNPPGHDPILRWLIKMQQRDERPRDPQMTTIRRQIIGLLLIGLLMLGGWFLILLALPMIVISVGTLCGAWIAAHTAERITRERIAQRYELLILIPRTEQEVHRLIWWSGYWNPRFWTQRVIDGVVALHLFGLFLLMLFSVALLGSGLGWLLEISLLFMAWGSLYYNVVQSVTLGSLIGMILPLRMGNQSGIGWYAILFFLMAQIAGYVVGLAVALPMLLWGGWLYPLMMVALFGVREIGVAILANYWENYRGDLAT